MQVENNRRISDAIFVEQLETKENHEEMLWYMLSEYRISYTKNSKQNWRQEDKCENYFEELIWVNEW